MLYSIKHWYLGELPKGTFKAKLLYYPEYVSPTKKNPEQLGKPSKTECDVIFITDIHKFVEEYGTIQLVAPTRRFPHWHVWITDKSGRFSQK
jgi:hypothetical protein